MKVAIKKLARPFQSAVHAKRTYRELRMLKVNNITATDDVVFVRELPQQNISTTQLATKTNEYS